MKPADSDSDTDTELRDEYDFSAAIRGRHHSDYQRGTNLVLLDADVAAAFPDAAAVNNALRLLLRLARQQLPPVPKPSE
ncbi:hypothetical protein [Plasticicumulans sp.]|uniref:hypothetical protein n=1 Tax=Plasticicumulans sp. TaxID=2307179 RepID=UPI002C180ABE|nr:hypothetical protein [Plasticicumulans sp.]